MDDPAGNIKQLGKGFLFFGLGYFMHAIVNVILLPIYVRYISSQEYGILAILTAFGAILTIIMDISVNRAIERFYIEYPEDKRKEFLCSVFIYILIHAAAIGIFLSIFSPRLALLFFDADLSQYSYYIILQIWISFFLVFSRAASAVCVIKERSRPFAILKIVDFTVLIITTLLFLIILKRGLGGIIEALFISTGIMTIFYILLVLPEFTFSFKLIYIKKFLDFSLPLLLYRIFLISVGYVDRFFINNFLTLSQVAIYSVGSRFSMATEVIISSFAIAWPPFYYNRTKENGSEAFFGEIVTLWLAFVIFVALGISVLGRELVILFTVPPYYNAYRIIPVLALGYIFLSFYSFSIATLLYAKQTKVLPSFSGIICLFNLAFLALIKGNFGITGPAISKTVSYFMMWCIMHIFTLSASRVKYEYKKLAKIFVIALLMFMAGFNVRTAHTAVNMVLKVCLIASYPFLLHALGMIDLRKAVRLLSKKPARENFAAIDAGESE